MATSTIGMQIKEIKATWQSAILPADSLSVTVTANVPSGYKFLCWTQVTSSGWVGHAYPADPTNETTDMWTTESRGASNRAIRCGYLYYK